MMRNICGDNACDPSHNKNLFDSIVKVNHQLSMVSPELAPVTGGAATVTGSGAVEVRIMLDIANAAR